MRRKPQNLTIRLSDLGQTGLVINETLNLSDLNDRMQASPQNDITFEIEPSVALVVTKLPGGAEAKGSISTSYQQPCGRCLDQLSKPLSVKFSYQLKPHENAVNPELDDQGLIFYTGEHVDLTEHLQEKLILALTPYNLPECDSQGRCLECKKTFNAPPKEKITTKNSLAGMLTEAGLKINK